MQALCRSLVLVVHITAQSREECCNASQQTSDMSEAGPILAQKTNYYL